MAIQEIDKSKTSLVGSFMKDYRDECQKRKQRDDGSSVFTVMIASTSVVVLGIFGMMVLGDDIYIPDIEQDTIIQEGFTSALGYEALKTDGQVYAAIKQDGLYRLYSRSLYPAGTLLYEDSYEIALQDISRIVESIDTAIENVENGQLNGVNLPGIVSFEDLSEPYIVGSDDVYRQVEGWNIVPPSEGENYLEQLESAREEWNAIRQEIFEGHYGMDEAALTIVPDEAEIEKLKTRHTLLLAPLALAFGGMAHFGTIGFQTALTRRRRREQNMRPK